MVENKMVCPIQSSDYNYTCLKENCALWIGETPNGEKLNICAFKLIGLSLWSSNRMP